MYSLNSSKLMSSCKANEPEILHNETRVLPIIEPLSNDCIILTASGNPIFLLERESGSLGKLYLCLFICSMILETRST